MRSDAVRWALVVVLTPLLALGALGGATVLAHRHDGGGLHLHAPCDDVGGAPPGLSWAPEHRHCDPVDPDGGSDDRDAERPCDGSLITLPDHSMVPSRGMIAPRPTPAYDGGVAIAANPMALAPARPGPGRAPRGADRRPRRARDHLLRTSRALLL